MEIIGKRWGGNTDLIDKNFYRIFRNYLTVQENRPWKGFLVTNLKQMRKFYLTYVNDQIGQAVSGQFKNLPTVSSGRKFFLS